MRGSALTTLLLALSLTTTACSFETQLEGLDFECSEDLPCGEGFVCDLTAGTCVAQGVTQLAPACTTLACTNEEELRCSPDGEVVGVQRCVWKESLGCLVWDPVHTCADTLECTEDVCDPSKIACVNGQCPAPEAGCSKKLTTGCLIVLSGEETCKAEGEMDETGCRSCQSEVRADAWSNVPNDFPCDDEDVCSTGDACETGFCIPGSPKDCSDGLVCTLDSCDAETGACTSELAPGSCFIDGACIPAGSLSPDNSCLACNPELSTETYTPVMNQTPCDDTNVCTVSDQCTGGVCQGSIKVCDDGVSCTEDLCEPQGDLGCVHQIPAGVCVIEGLCWDEGLPVSGDGCLTCDPDANNQAWTLIAPDTACDSGDYCVVAEVCAAGACQGGQPRGCDDGLTCTTDTCSSDIESCIQTLDEDRCLIDGVCKDDGDLNAPGGCKTCDPSFATDAWVPAPSGISCSDQNPCTLSDTCSEGVCESGPQKDCADELSCTVDTCDSETGLCQHALDGGHCELDGACVAAGELSPENPCLACQPEKAETAYTLRESGSPCDDQDICTVNDACDASGLCAGGQQAVCDDGLACTSDTCVSADDTGCVTELSEGSCVIEGACVTAGATSVPDGCLSCLPEVATDAWTESSCSDDLGCTTDVCANDTGLCENPLIEGSCLIEGVCYANGDTTQDNACLRCETDYNTQSWYPSFGDVCADYQNGEALCQAGACQYNCAAPYADCDAQVDNGCEVNTDEELYHCGACGNLCTGGLACVNGECSADCGELTKCGAYCADLDTSLSHCGGCDIACGYDNGLALCVDGQCELGKCDDDAVDLNEDPSDGCECVITGSEVCDGLDNDCDGVVDNVDAEIIAYDPENCLECGVVCPSSDPSKVGACGKGGCEEAFCDLGSWNLNGDAGDGCEYLCLYNKPTENCDGVDQNCDGEIDEGYDLLSDIQNCGACGVTCEATALPPGQPDAVESYTCVAGQCFVESCEVGWQDKDLDYTNGCEHAFVPDGVFHVNWLKGNDVTADGSEESPFATIQVAIDSAPQEGWVIQIAGGTYGTFTVPVDKPGLTIQGVGTTSGLLDLTLIQVPDGGTGVVIRADDTTVSDMKVEGGAIGISVEPADGVDVVCNDDLAQQSCIDAVSLMGQEGAFDLGDCGASADVWNWVGGECRDCALGILCDIGPDECPCQEGLISGLVLEHLVVTGQTGDASASKEDPGGDATGVWLSGTQDAILAQVSLEDQQGGAGYSALPASEGDGGRAVGLRVERSTGLTVLGVEATGQLGGVSGINQAGNTALSAQGGSAIGLWAERCDGCQVDGLAVMGLTGGPGFVAYDNGTNNYTPQRGGQAIGVYVQGYGESSVEGLVVTDLHGGAGGPPTVQAGLTRGQVGGVASGIMFASYGFDDFTYGYWHVSSGWSFEGEIGDLHGGAHSGSSGAEQVAYGVFLEPENLDHDLSGLAYDGEPIITVVGQSEVTLSDLNLMTDHNPTNWGKVLIADSTDITLQDSVIGNVTGARGVTGSWNGQVGQSGGDARGVSVLGCTGCVLTGLTIQNIEPGQGGDSGGGTPEGAGGRAMGIYLGATELGPTTGALLTDISIAELGQGARGEDTSLNDYGDILPVAQQGFGVWLEESSLANQVAQSVVVDGDPVIYQYGVDNKKIEQFELSSNASNTTNWGAVAIIDSENVMVTSGSISDVSAVHGSTGYQWTAELNPPTVGDPAVAIRLENCGGCTVSAVTIRSVDGGAGGSAMKDPAPSGDGIGLLIDGGSVDVYSVEISTVRGGHAGHTSTSVDGLTVGAGVGLRAQGEASVTATGLLITELQGGVGGEQHEVFDKPMTGGPVYGIDVVDASLDLMGSTLASLQGGSAPSSNVKDKDLEDGPAVGVRVGPLTGSKTVTISHVIISGVTGGSHNQTHPCVFSDASNAISKVQIQQTDLHACGAQGTDQVDDMENVASLGAMWFVDPLFINPGAGKSSNYHLFSASPLIDAGVSGLNDCEFVNLEPNPNGCARNLGYYGGTDEASTKAGAQHCDCSDGE